MITIKIERSTTVHYNETQQLCTKEVPTDKLKRSEYGGRDEILFEREYAPTVVTKSREKTVTLLTQEISDEDKFDLTAVIKAINGIQQ